jgi:hypothetical protein
VIGIRSIYPARVDIINYVEFIRDTSLLERVSSHVTFKPGAPGLKIQYPKDRSAIADCTAWFAKRLKARETEMMSEIAVNSQGSCDAFYGKAILIPRDVVQVGNYYLVTKEVFSATYHSEGLYVFPKPSNPKP